jgi:hypothetical protein
MSCQIPTAANGRYVRRMAIMLGFYMVSLVASISILRHLHPNHVATILLALLPSIAIVGTIAVVGLYLKEESDEFQRMLLIQSLLWGMGCTLAITSVWGFLEMFADAPHLPQFYVFVIFWAIVSFAGGLISRRYRTSADE